MMWTEVPREDIATTFKPNDRVRVEIPNTRSYEGRVLEVNALGNDLSNVYVRLTLTSDTPRWEEVYPVTLYAFANRKWYRWEEDKPVSANDVKRMESQARLRLRQPDELEAEYAKLGAELKEERSLLKARAVIVGKQTYVLNEGDHLRVWWEDGRLHTELVQGVER